MKKKCKRRKVERLFLVAGEHICLHRKQTKKIIKKRMKLDEWIQNQCTKFNCISLKQPQLVRKHKFSKESICNSNKETKMMYT